MTRSSSTAHRSQPQQSGGVGVSVSLPAAGPTASSTATQQRSLFGGCPSVRMPSTAVLILMCANFLIALHLVTRRGEGVRMGSDIGAPSAEVSAAGSGGNSEAPPLRAGGHSEPQAGEEEGEGKNELRRPLPRRDKSDTHNADEVGGRSGALSPSAGGTSIMMGASNEDTWLRRRAVLVPQRHGSSSSSTSSSLLLGDPSIVVSAGLRGVCRGDGGGANARRGGGEGEGRGAGGASFGWEGGLPTCPSMGSSSPHAAGPPASASPAAADTVVDRNTDWVNAKYALYARRCAARDGLMWSQLSMRSYAMIATKVLKLVLLGHADTDATVYPEYEEEDAVGGARRLKRHLAAYASRPYYHPNEQRAIVEGLLYGYALPSPRSSPRSTEGPRAQSSGSRDVSLRLLDWGGGCGVGVRFFSNYLLEAFGNYSSVGGGVGDTPPSAPPSPPTPTPSLTLQLMGIDLMEGAIHYANTTMLPAVVGRWEEERRGRRRRRRKGDVAAEEEGASPPSHSLPPLPHPSSAARFCQADGTDLSFIPSESFDVVTAFGALLHVPRDQLCGTVAEMLRVVVVGGAVWGGYIDDADTIERLAACRFYSHGEGEGEGAGGGSEGKPAPVGHGSCSATSSSYSIDFTLIDERQWHKRVGMPKALLKRRPHSMLWRKVPLV